MCCDLRTQCIKQLNSLSLQPHPAPLPELPGQWRAQGPLIAEARLSNVSFIRSLSHDPIPHPVTYLVTCLLLKHLSSLPVSLPTALYSITPWPVTASGMGFLSPAWPTNSVLSPFAIWAVCQKMKIWHPLPYSNTWMSSHCSLNPVQTLWPCW